MKTIFIHNEPMRNTNKRLYINPYSEEVRATAKEWNKHARHQKSSLFLSQGVVATLMQKGYTSAEILAMNTKTKIYEALYPSPYSVRQSENGEVLEDVFFSLADAIDEVRHQESEDRENGEYTPDWYEIADAEGNIVPII